MKKIGTILLMVFFMIGCGHREEPRMDAVDLETEQLENEELQTDESNMQDMIPEWVLPYTELGEKEDSVYLGGVRAEDGFKIIDNKLQFPESTMLVVTGETYGTDRVLIKNNSEKILEAINIIEKENILSDDNAKNSNATLLGHKLSIVLLDVKSRYMLVEITSFNDDRHYIDTICEDDISAQSVFIKSKELTQLLQDMINYKVVNLENINTAEKLSFINAKDNTTYDCTQQEIEEFCILLKGIKQEANGLCSGPFDINIVMKTDEDYIYMKWSNDSCGILAVEGQCYEIIGEGQEWLDNIISANF